MGGDARSVVGRGHGNDERRGRGGGGTVGDRVCVNRVGGAAPSLNLLGNTLGVGGGENAELGRVAKGVREVVQEGGDGLCDTNGG